MKTLFLLAVLSLFTACKFDINGDLKGAKAAGIPDQTQGQGSRVFAIDNAGDPYVLTFLDDGTYTLRQYAMSWGMWIEAGGTYTESGLNVTIDSYSFLQLSDLATVNAGGCGMAFTPVPITNVVFSSDYSEIEYDQTPQHFVLYNVEVTPFTAPDVSAMPNLCP